MKTEVQVRQLLDSVASIQDRLKSLKEQSESGSYLRIGFNDATQIIDMQLKLQPVFSAMHWVLESPQCQPDATKNEGTLTIDQYVFNCEKFLCDLASTLNKPINPSQQSQPPEQRPSRMQP